jgi:hypothetical protein
MRYAGDYTMIRSHILTLIFVGTVAVAAHAQDKAVNPIPGVDPTTAIGQMQQQFLMQFDANRDGKLDPQEQMLAQEAMRRNGLNMGIAPSGFPGADQFNKQFDRDRDGKLSPQEAALAQAVFQRMRNGARGGVRTGGGASSPPQPPAFPIAPQAPGKPDKVNPLVKRFDKDGDGKLNADEKAAAQAEFKKDKDKPKDKEKNPEKDKAKDQDAKKDKAPK